MTSLLDITTVMSQRMARHSQKLHLIVLVLDLQEHISLFHVGYSAYILTKPLTISCFTQHGLKWIKKIY